MSSSLGVLEKECPFLDIFSGGGICSDGFTRYRILDRFGEGQILIYPLFPGFYLSVNNFRLKDFTFKNKEHSRLSRPFLKIDYCLSGEYRFNDTERKIGIVGKGDCGCYAGESTFSKVEFKDGLCCSISLFCYREEFKTSLKQIWGDSGTRLDKYYKKLAERDEYLITGNDCKSAQLLEEVRKLTDEGDPVSLRLRSVELFFREIDMFLDNKKKEKKYYSRIHLKKVARIKKIIDENYNRDFTVEDLSASECINLSYLKSIFRERYGDSIYSYKKKLRLKNAEIMLRETNMHIYEIVQAVGYTDAGKFTRSFKNHYNTTPGEYRLLNQNLL